MKRAFILNEGSSDCRQIQRNLKLSTVFFPFTIPTKESSISALGATFTTGTASAFSLAVLSPGASARAVPVGVFAPATPIDLCGLLKKEWYFYISYYSKVIITMITKNQINERKQLEILTIE